MRIITKRNDLAGQYVLVRSSANVPLKDGEVANDYRLQRALPTIAWLKDAGARVIIIAHIGREATDTLKPVFRAFQKLIPITWGGSITDSDFQAKRDAMQDGDVMLVENLRQDPGEKNADESLARLLAQYGDIYVNDAFDNIHRDHASMVILPKLLPAYAGLTLCEEVENVSKAMCPTPPSLFLIGGAKFETKMPLIEKYLTTYDQVFVGGALLNDILRADGYEVGQSLVSPVRLKDTTILKSDKLLRPIDVLVRNNEVDRVVLVDAITAEDSIIDIGPQTLERLAPFISQAKTILWNGPVGMYEGGAKAGTQALARLVAKSDAFSVVGGGDTVAAIEELDLNDQFGFVSIGGGAMLTFLEAGSTKALDLLNQQD